MIARPASDPLFARLSTALRARDFASYFAAHDELLSREGAPIAKVRVEPGDVLIVKCQSEHESLSGLVTRLGPGVKAVLLPGPGEVAVTAGEGER